jgi:hypothetical protein
MHQSRFEPCPEQSVQDHQSFQEVVAFPVRQVRRIHQEVVVAFPVRQVRRIHQEVVVAFPVRQVRRIRLAEEVWSFLEEEVVVRSFLEEEVVVPRLLVAAVEAVAGRQRLDLGEEEVLLSCLSPNE